MVKYLNYLYWKLKLIRHATILIKINSKFILASIKYAERAYGWLNLQPMASLLLSTRFWQIPLEPLMLKNLIFFRAFAVSGGLVCHAIMGFGIS